MKSESMNLGKGIALGDFKKIVINASGFALALVAQGGSAKVGMSSAGSTT